MKRAAETRHLRLAAAVLGGALLFVLGLGLAARHLPPWNTPFPSSAEAARWQAALEGRLGVRADPEGLRLDFITRRMLIDQALASIALPPGLVKDDILVRSRATVRFESGRPRSVMVGWGATGTPYVVRWQLPGEARYDPARFRTGGVPPREVVATAHALLHPGETLTALRPPPLAFRPYLVWSVSGSQPAERVIAFPDGRYAFVLRVPDPTQASLEAHSATLWQMAVVLWMLVLLVVGLVFALFLRRRIDLRLGALIAAAGLLGSLPAWFDPSFDRSFLWIGSIAMGLFVCLTWSLGESLLRPLEPGLLVGLDALGSGRLGPFSGRALLWGLAGGLGLAGLELVANALSLRGQGVPLRGPWLVLPAFSEFNAFTQAGIQVSWILLSLALSRRFLPWRYAFVTTLVFSSLYVEPWGPCPWWMAALLNVGLAAVLLGLTRLAGLAVLLVGSLSYHLAFLAAFAGLHPEWLGRDFAVSLALLSCLLGLGFFGLSRPAQKEIAKLRTPGFIRRLEEEKRLEGEIAFLARAQKGLLPPAPPQIPGWELAVGSAEVSAVGNFHDFIEDPAGRWWLAAGDVAGQGLACAVVQAMTKAALSALVVEEREPSDVLLAVHRILKRKSGFTHGMTTLALLRLDITAGAGVLANAGHPAPLWLAAGGALETLALGGLPLGVGPDRTCDQEPLHWQPGSVLLLGSDGLWDARDPEGRPFYPGKAQEVLTRFREASAADIAQGLLAAWREHLAGEEARDDASVVVVRRLP